jgi:hypothetical protein
MTIPNINQKIGVINEMSDIYTKASKTNNFLKMISEADDIIYAKSIASQARNNIFLYPVMLSSSIGNVELAANITKYIEIMNGVFTMIVSGLNAVANDNDDVKNVIKSISAENFDPHKISTEYFLPADIDKALKTASVEYVSKLDIESAPRIGKNAKSTEASQTPNTQNGPSNNQFGHSLNTSFIDKLEKLSMVPTILKITFIINGENLTVPIVIKANPRGVGTEEMKLFIESVLAGRAFNWLRNYKWRSGEISTTEYLFGTDLAENDKKLYKSLGRNPIYIEFMKRKAKSRSSGVSRALISGKGNVIPPTASLIVTTDDLVNATKLDLSRFTKNDNLIKRIMEKTFIMCFGIVDILMETVSFYYMGYSQPFRYSFNELSNKHNSSNSTMDEAFLMLSKKV